MCETVVSWCPDCIFMGDVLHAEFPNYVLQTVETPPQQNLRAFWFKVICLKDHIHTVADVFQEVTDMMQIPASEIDPVQVGEFIDEQKATLKHVDADVKDAKRRIQGAKGPRPKKAVNTEEECASESE